MTTFDEEINYSYSRNIDYENNFFEKFKATTGKVINEDVGSVQKPFTNSSVKKFKLNNGIVSEIVFDIASLYPEIFRVGLIGSFVRSNGIEYNDIDFIVDCNNEESFGNFSCTVQKILLQQFSTDSDFVLYSTAFKLANKPPKKDYQYNQKGYIQMLKEVKWIYEKS